MTQWGDSDYIPVMPDDFLFLPCIDGPMEGELIPTYPPRMDDGELNYSRMYPFEGAKFESIQGHKIKIALYRWCAKEQVWYYSHDDEIEVSMLVNLTFHEDKHPTLEEIKPA